MEPRELEGLLTQGGDADALLARLHQASRALQLPVDVDRQLYELLDSGGSPEEILEQLTRYVAGGQAPRRRTG